MAAGIAKFDKLLKKLILHTHEISEISGLSVTSAMYFKGEITSNFDSSLIVGLTNGWVYTINNISGVEDTATGQTFNNKEEIAWNGTNWTILGSNISQSKIVYVGKHGSDVNTGDRASSAMATIQAAYNYAVLQTPAEGSYWNIIILDGGEYTENLTFTNGYINVFGPNSKITGTHSISGAKTNFVIDHLKLTGTTGLDFSSGDLKLFTNKIEVFAGVTNGIVNSGTGTLFLSSKDISLPSNLTGGGIINSSTGKTIIEIDNANVNLNSPLINASAGSIFGNVKRITESASGTGIKLTGSAAAYLNIQYNAATAAYNCADTSVLYYRYLYFTGTETFTGTTLRLSGPEHNNRYDLQGGTTGEFYHLIQNEHDLVEQLNDDIIWVWDTGANDDIGNAIAASSPGDKIYVLPGNYTETTNWFKDGLDIFLFRGASITATTKLIYQEDYTDYDVSVRGYGDFSINTNLVEMYNDGGGSIYFQCNDITYTGVSAINLFTCESFGDVNILFSNGSGKGLANINGVANNAEIKFNSFTGADINTINCVGVSSDFIIEGNIILSTNHTALIASSCDGNGVFIGNIQATAGTCISVSGSGNRYFTSNGSLSGNASLTTNVINIDGSNIFYTHNGIIENGILRGNFSSGTYGHVTINGNMYNVSTLMIQLGTDLHLSNMMINGNCFNYTSEVGGSSTGKIIINGNVNFSSSGVIYGITHIVGHCSGSAIDIHGTLMLSSGNHKADVSADALLKVNDGGKLILDNFNIENEGTGAGTFCIQGTGAGASNLVIIGDNSLVVDGSVSNSLEIENGHTMTVENRGTIWSNKDKLLTGTGAYNELLVGAGSFIANTNISKLY